MRDKIREMEELKLAYKNSLEGWRSLSLIHPKPGPERCRMTVDLCVLNASTKTASVLPPGPILLGSHRTAWPMRYLQNDLQDLHGFEYFATMDFCQGYWQVSLHKDSQHCQSLNTAYIVYKPSRVLYGDKSAMQHLQSVPKFLI
jgi:hypothetical protein